MLKVSLVIDCGRTKETNPHMCRLRDLTYAAPIFVDVIYYKGDRRHIRKRDLEIGMLPVMLRSNLCVLSGKSKEEEPWQKTSAVSSKRSVCCVSGHCGGNYFES